MWLLFLGFIPKDRQIEVLGINFYHILYRLPTIHYSNFKFLKSVKRGMTERSNNIVENLYFIHSYDLIDFMVTLSKTLTQIRWINWPLILEHFWVKCNHISKLNDFLVEKDKPLLNGTWQLFDHIRKTFQASSKIVRHDKSSGLAEPWEPLYEIHTLSGEHSKQI